MITCGVYTWEWQAKEAIMAAELKTYPDVLSTDDLCAILRISRGTAYKLIKAGEIPARKICRNYRILKKDLISYFSR